MFTRHVLGRVNGGKNLHGNQNPVRSMMIRSVIPLVRCWSTHSKLKVSNFEVGIERRFKTCSYRFIGKVIKSSHEDSHESVDENEIEGNHAEIISADSVEVEDVHDDAEIDLVDSLEDVPVHEDDLVDDPELDADIEDPIEGEEIDSDEITEPEVPSILAETPEVIADHEEIFASSSEENLNDADMVAEENNHTPFRATASTNAIHQKISSTTVQPIIQTNLVENTMSSSQIETLIQNLVGLSCRCTRSHDGICPLLKKPNDVESRVRISRNRPKNISNEGVQLKTSRKFPRRGPSAEKSSKETVSKQRRKQKVGNTINIKLGSSGRSGRPRKPKISNSEAHPNFERHRNLRLRTKPTPSKELHIILDDKENDIDDDFSDNDAIEEDHSSDNDEEELAPASDADEDLQFFRNHGSSSTTSTATTPHNKSPRNRRTRGGRRRTRLGPARKNASVSIEQLRPEESVADEANASIQRTQRGVQSSVPRRIRRRKVRRGAAQQEVQRIPGTPGNSEAAQDSVHREALSVGLVGDEIDSLAGKVKLESQNQVSAQTAGALLKQFSGLYQRFKRVIGNENVADVKILR